MLSGSTLNSFSAFVFWRKAVFPAIFAFFIFISSAYAATYYVATNGSDSNPGSESAPWQTLKKAFNTVRGGDTVLVRKGIYSALTVKDLHPPAGQWITFKSYPGEKATINTANGQVFRIMGASYLIIEGFEITDLGYDYKRPFSCDILTDAACQRLGNGPRTVGLGLEGVASTSSSKSDVHHIIIRNNEIHHNTSHGLASNEGTYDVQILNNHLHHNGYAGLNQGYGTYITGQRFLVRGNTLNNNAGNNMRVGNTSGDRVAVDWIIENNVAYNNHGPFMHNRKPNQGGFGYALYGFSGGIFRNNISYGGYGTGIWVANRSKPTLVYNNTFYGHGLGGMQLSGTSIARNNIVFNNSRREGGGVEAHVYGNSTFENNLVGGGDRSIIVQEQAKAGNNIKVDPLFVNPSAGDFGLQASSPALDKGMTLAEVPTDFTGKARPEGASYDIGAFEGAGSKADVLPGMGGGLPPGAGGGSGINDPLGLGNCMH